MGNNKHGERQRQQIDNLWQEWDLLDKKRSTLRRARILETHPDEKFRLGEQITESEEEIKQIEHQLSELEAKAHRTEEERKQFEQQLSSLKANSDKKHEKGILLFDIDGTLLKPNENFRSEKGRQFVSILKELIKENFKIVLITGNDYNVQHKRVLLPFIEQSIANSVFCFSDGGSRAFEFNEADNDFIEIQEYSRENLIKEEQTERITSVFYSLLSDFIEQHDTLLIPNVELYGRTLDYIDLRIYPIKPSFRSNKEKFEDFCNDIKEICSDRKEMKSATFDIFAEQSSPAIIIRAHGQDPEADVYKLQGKIYREILRRKKYQNISKPEIEKRGGDVICQIALKPFNEDRLRADFRRIFEEKLKMEGYDDFAILTGGATTIDIQLKGINKAKAIRFLKNNKSYDPQCMIYFGDEFSDFGNDYAVVTMAKEERPKLIVNVGKVSDIPERVRRNMILDGNGPEGTKNFLELLLFGSKL